MNHCLKCPLKSLTVDLANHSPQNGNPVIYVSPGHQALKR